MTARRGLFSVAVLRMLLQLMYYVTCNLQQHLYNYVCVFMCVCVIVSSVTIVITMQFYLCFFFNFSLAKHRSFLYLLLAIHLVFMPHCLQLFKLSCIWYYLLFSCNTFRVFFFEFIYYAPNQIKKKESNLDLDFEM